MQDDEREGVTVSLKPSATIRYTAMRLGIFVGCLVVVAGLVRLGWVPSSIGDANFAWIVLLALVLSAPLLLRPAAQAARPDVRADFRTRRGCEGEARPNRSQEDLADDAARVNS